MLRELGTFIVTTVEVDEEEGTFSIGSSAVAPDMPDGQGMEAMRMAAHRWTRVFSVLQEELLQEYAEQRVAADTM